MIREVLKTIVRTDPFQLQVEDILLLCMWDNVSHHFSALYIRFLGEFRNIRTAIEASLVITVSKTAECVEMISICFKQNIQRFWKMYFI